MERLKIRNIQSFKGTSVKEEMSKTWGEYRKLQQKVSYIRARVEYRNEQILKDRGESEWD